MKELTVYQYAPKDVFSFNMQSLDNKYIIFEDFFLISFYRSFTTTVRYIKVYVLQMF